MSKAILVIEMPSSCSECKVKFSDGYSDYCTVKKCEDVYEYGDSNTKPNWCPLKPAPQKKEVSFNYWDRAVFANGYNACIDEILKEV